jgi:hypothetical protein
MALTGSITNPFASDIQQFGNLADKLEAWQAFTGLREDVGTAAPVSGAGAGSRDPFGLSMPWYMKAAIGCAVVAAFVVLSKKRA